LHAQAAIMTASADPAAPVGSCGDGYGADPAEPPAVEEFLQPVLKPTKISLQLALTNSLTKAELGDYQKLSAEEVYEKAQSVKTLHLEFQNICEIAKLDFFESCDVLYLQYNRIEVLEGLDFMPKLQFLALQHNRIQVVENLEHLSELEFLDLAGNLVADFNVAELPKRINILNLKDNPCSNSADYLSLQERLRAHLPDLAYLDGVALDGDSELARSLGSGALEGARPGTASSAQVQLDAGEKGLSAYDRKDEMQLGLASSIEDQIQAYCTEAGADVDSFSRRIETAVSRSEGRRKHVEEQISTAKKDLAIAEACAAAAAVANSLPATEDPQKL